MERVPFGRYVLKERLAAGGMGEVFRAVAVGESGFEKPVVVKRILPAHAGRVDLAELFIAEAKLMTRLAHPNLVQVLDFGRGEGSDYFLVLELVDGVDLGRLQRSFEARGERFPVPLALFVAAQALRGLHHAHAKSAGPGGWLVHRDVSPGNVLLSAEGEVKVADFGVALVSRPDDGGKGAARGLVGKPQYMAPEQYDGADVDPRADLFSVGVMLFFLLTGGYPFEGEALEAQQDAAHRGDFGRARDQRPEVPAALDAVLRRALSPDRGDRFPDARAMAQAIEALAGPGLKLASSDDVADAVQAAVRAEPSKGRRVIALSGSVRRDDDEPERELTRTGGAGGVGAFTLRVPPPDAPEGAPGVEGREPAGLSATGADRAPLPRGKHEVPTVRLPSSGHRPGLSAAPELAPKAPHAPPDETDPPVIPLDGGRSPARLALLVTGALALAGTIAFALRSGSPTQVDTASVASADPSPQPPRSADPPVELAPPPSSTAPIDSARAAPRSTAPRPLAPPSSPALTATAIASAPTAAPADDCTGRVRFASSASWKVSGGPQTAETPGVYTWRCGSFSLTAVSRLDATQIKHASVTVRAGAEALVDLR